MGSKKQNLARTGFPYGEVLHERIIKTGENVVIRRLKPTDDANGIFAPHLRSMKSDLGYPYCPTGGLVRHFLRFWRSWPENWVSRSRMAKHLEIKKRKSTGLRKRVGRL
ncbi:Uncharacterised protein [uncultured archaeon]|nr:Uncharacterised protein [uncultured archaeon]